MASKSFYISEGMLLPNHDTNIFRTEKELKEKLKQKIHLDIKNDSEAGY